VSLLGLSAASLSAGTIGLGIITTQFLFPKIRYRSKTMKAFNFWKITDIIISLNAN
jgi:hypothetical protein